MSDCCHYRWIVGIWLVVISVLWLLSGTCSEECIVNGGNCIKNYCVADSGMALKPELFIVQESRQYSWMTSSDTNSTNSADTNDTSSTNSSVQRKSPVTIPQLIHRSWKTMDIPLVYKPLKDNCDRLHPKWTSILWTDGDNYELVKREYPEYLYIYNRFPMAINKADFIRYLYMYHYGGVYMDLDVDCRFNLDNFIQNKTLILGQLGTDFPHNIPNAILFSVKQHPFWLFLINLIIFRLHSNKAPEHLTGPIILRDAYYLYSKLDTSIYLADPLVLYGLDWRLLKEFPFCKSNEFGISNLEKCRQYFPSTLLLTYWQHSWENKFTHLHPN